MDGPFQISKILQIEISPSVHLRFRTVLRYIVFRDFYFISMISREIHNLTSYLILPLLMRSLIRHYTIGYQEIKHVVLQKVLKFSRFILSFLHSWERNCKCKLQRYYSCVHLNPTNSCHVDLSGMSCLHLLHNGVKIFLNF
jgi:hypothetical protein